MEEKYYYIHKNRVVKRSEPLPLNAGYPLTSNISDQEEKYVKLSPEQCDFADANPGATIQELWNKELVVIEPDIREEILSLISSYDISDEVNGFFVNDNHAWFDRDTRASLRASIDAAEKLGEIEVQWLINGVLLTLPIDFASEKLAKIQRYADACFLVTEQNKLYAQSENNEVLTAYRDNKTYKQKRDALWDYYFF